MIQSGLMSLLNGAKYAPFLTRPEARTPPCCYAQGNSIPYEL